MRQRQGAVLCSSCGRLVHVDEPVCPNCGARSPGLWGFGPALRQVFGDGFSPEMIIGGTCCVLYLASVFIEPSALAASVRDFSLFGFGAPGYKALRALGMTGGEAWIEGHIWTLLTASWLHGSLLHLVFNLSWTRSLAPLAADSFGSARLVVLWCVTGAMGFLLSNLVSGAPTIGASASVFGLLGALLAWGRRRGGTYGQDVARQSWIYAGMGFFLGMAMPNVNNFAHLGGFASGYIMGRIFPSREQRKETRLVQVSALLLLVFTALGVLASLLRWGLPGR